MSEEKTDNILDDIDEEVQEIDPREDSAKKNDKPTLDETVQKLIGKAGNHMESTLIGNWRAFEIFPSSSYYVAASYVGLVMGYLIKNSEDYEQRVSHCSVVELKIIKILCADSRIFANKGFQRGCPRAGQTSQFHENDLHWDRCQQQGHKGGIIRKE